MPKITKRIVDAATVDPGGRFIVWDAELKGFGLLVLPTGVKSYVFDYRTPEGVKRRATIGQYGAWTPDQARKQADKWRQVVKAGGDPLRDKQALRAAPTVNDLIDRYLEGDQYKSKAPATRSSDLGRITRHLRPLLGRRHVHILTLGEIERAFAAIGDGKTAAKVKTGKHGLARVTGGPVAATEAIKLIRSIFRWGVREGLSKNNPAEHIKLAASGVRETILESVDDYGRLFATLDTMEREGRIGQSHADAIRLIALTGCRRGEATALRWQHVDLKAGRVVFPPAEHKTGKATGKPRVIGLPAAAQGIIARNPEGAPSDYVLTPAHGGRALSLGKAWRRVRAEAKLPRGIGLHGLRHSLASHLAMGDAQAAEIMTALGHRQLSTTARYIHFAQDARQALAEKAASVALAGLALGDSKPAKVVELKGCRK
jgi:site-specific recombinase XerD